MSRVAGVIQGVPARSAFHGDIADAFEAQGCPVYESIDHHYRGPFHGFCRALEKGLDTDAAHILILQDDLIPQGDFIVEAALNLAERGHSGTAGVSLFMPPQKPLDDAYKAGFCAVEVNVIWNLCRMFSRDFAEQFLAANGGRKEQHDDVELVDFANRNGWAFLMAVPSLVQHNLNIESTLGHLKSIAGIKRMARYTAKREGKVADWWKEAPIKWQKT